MKIDELIALLEDAAEMHDICAIPLDTDAELMRKAADVIKLLWEVAKENQIEKYRMLIDEMGGSDEVHAEKS